MTKKPGKIVVGYRYPRVDNIFRLFISGSFKKLYEVLLKIKLNDPSCGHSSHIGKTLIQ